jgi:hypothetical protein
MLLPDPLLRPQGTPIYPTVVEDNYSVYFATGSGQQEAAGRLPALPLGGGRGGPHIWLQNGREFRLLQYGSEANCPPVGQRRGAAPDGGIG